MLRLSQIGDVCNCIPTLRAIQRHWSDAEVTWIVRRTEGSILGAIPGVRLVVVDSSLGISEWRRIARALRGKRFDALLHMQASLWANLLSLTVRAQRRIVLDRGRAKDFQTLFASQRVRMRDRAHAVEAFLEFAYQLGAPATTPAWNMPKNAYRSTLESLPVAVPDRYYMVSPCASRPIRNWTAAGYAEVVRRIWLQHGIPSLVSGGNSELERSYARAIEEGCPEAVVNLVGRTSLTQLLALLEQAQFLIAPDSGPAHMATVVDTPVIGLYANTNPDRARPFNSQAWVVNQYPVAVRRYLNKSVDEVAWGTRVRVMGVMELISVEMVMEKVERLMEARASGDFMRGVG